MNNTVEGELPETVTADLMGHSHNASEVSLFEPYSLQFLS